MKSDLAKQIQESLKLKDVMEYYGVRFNSRGFARCPFHEEKTASLTIKHDRTGEHYKCFGCGAYGSVIDFVKELYGIGFGPAVIKLNKDFQLGLIDGKPPDKTDTRIIESYNKVRRITEERKAVLHRDYLRLCDLRRILDRSDEPDALKMVEALDYILDDHTEGRCCIWKEIMAGMMETDRRS